jgi:hypothetical protein
MGTLAKVLAAGRIVVGGAMLAMPEEAVGGWVGSRAAGMGGTQTITRACGVRDLVLGVGALSAFTRGQDARDWVGLAAACDVVDLAATVTSDDVPTSGKIMIGVLATSAIVVSAGYLMAGSD